MLKNKIEEIKKITISNIPENKISHCGLYYGEFGRFLFLLYCNDIDTNLLEKFLQKILVGMIENENNTAYGDGLAGELYLLDFLYEQNFVEIDIDRTRAIIEEKILSEMRFCMKKSYYDFMHGALGYGLYFLKRSVYIDYIIELVNFLYTCANRNSDDSIFKWESVLVYNTDIRGYNLSLSHGISSIIIFLSRILEAGIFNDNILRMITGSINYILSQEVDFSKFGFCFPNCIYKQNNDQILKSNLAWCYGDLGVGIALLKAGKVMNNNVWIDKAYDIFVKSINRFDKINVLDAGICHGSAGLAMIYRRIFLNSNRKEFEEAAQFWIDRTLKHSIFEKGLAGYLSFASDGRIQDYSLLTGVAGIGLVLLSYLHNNNQAWDELFLLS